MPTANYHYLSTLVGQLNTVTDVEANRITSPDDESGTRRVIRAVILPEFASLDDESQAACKNSLRYFLTTGKAPFYDILADQPEWPIEPPSDPRKLFVWVWEELFPSEDYRIEDTTSWEECNDASKARTKRR